MPSPSSNRVELGPILLAVGAVVLLVSLFVRWYEPDLTAWDAFEWLDLLLAGISLAVLAGAAGLLVSSWALIDPERVPLLVAAALAVVAVQLLDPPPAAGDATPTTGAWLALAGCFVMGAGTVLAFSRLRLQVSYEGRDPRRRVSTVDARSPSGGGVEAPTPPPEPHAADDLFAGPVERPRPGADPGFPDDLMRPPGAPPPERAPSEGPFIEPEGPGARRTRPDGEE